MTIIKIPLPTIYDNTKKFFRLTKENHSYFIVQITSFRSFMSLHGSYFIFYDYGPFHLMDEFYYYLAPKLDLSPGPYTV